MYIFGPWFALSNDQRRPITLAPAYIQYTSYTASSTPVRWNMTAGGEGYTEGWGRRHTEKV